MTIEALKELSDAVEAGKLDSFNEFATSWEAALGMYTPKTTSYQNSWAAYQGSLDAAKALHEALLPDWGWTWSDRGTGHVTPNSQRYSRLAQSAKSNDPARAWLLAILRALITQQESTHD